jgi:hypothetical protein
MQSVAQSSCHRCDVGMHCRSLRTTVHQLSAWHTRPHWCDAPCGAGCFQNRHWYALHCPALLYSHPLSLSLSLFASGRSTVCTHTHHTICGDQSQTLAVAAQLRCLQLLATLFDAKVLPDLSLSECARFGCCMAAAVARSTINAANQVQ